jgi:hypothetical protein
LIAMTFGPVLAVGLILGCSFPIVPRLVASALFGIVGCAVLLMGAP